MPETRFWHVLGPLWHEHFEPHELVGDAEPVYDQEGTWTGYRFGRGLLGLDREIVVSAGADKRRSGLFEARRLIRDAEPDGTRYDELVELLVKDNQRHDSTPRVIRSSDRPFEDTRGGRMKFLIDNWSDLAGQDLDMAEYEIAAGKRSGAHRHIAEELLLVIEGSGFDDHDGSTHPWEAGDLICIPPMTAHAHVNNGSETARLVSVWSHHPANEFLGGFEHIEDATGWSSDH